jgi:hypothetical protein
MVALYFNQTGETAQKWIASNAGTENVCVLPRKSDTRDSTAIVMYGDAHAC